MVSVPPGHLHFIISNCRMKEGRVGVSVLSNPGGVPRMANDEVSGSENIASTQGASASLRIMNNANRVVLGRRDRADCRPSGMSASSASHHCFRLILASKHLKQGSWQGMRLAETIFF